MWYKCITLISKPKIKLLVHVGGRTHREVVIILITVFDPKLFNNIWSVGPSARLFAPTLLELRGLELTPGRKRSFKHFCLGTYTSFILFFVINIRLLFSGLLFCSWIFRRLLVLFTFEIVLWIYRDPFFQKREFDLWYLNLLGCSFRDHVSWRYKRRFKCNFINFLCITLVSSIYL